MTVEQLKEIAKEAGITATVRKLGGKIYANVNGLSFVVQSADQFKRAIVEKANAPKAQPIDLTSRLERFERRAIEMIEADK